MHKTSRHSNLIRHLKLIHGIENRAGRNATKNLYTDGKSTDVMTSERNMLNTPVCSTVMNSKEMFPGMNLPELTWKNTTEEEKQDGGGHYHEREEQPRSNPVDALYTPELIEKFGSDLRRKKRHILDCVLDTIPEHLKAKDKFMCDKLKCDDSVFINAGHELIIDGELDCESNIRDYIMDSLTEPAVPESLQFKILEKQNRRLKHNIDHLEKALAKARGVSRCRKFESIVDGTVDRCEFSEETDSDEDSEEDSDENKDGDMEADSGEYVENGEDGDEEEYTDDTEDEEPFIAWKLNEMATCKNCCTEAKLETKTTTEKKSKQKRMKDVFDETETTTKKKSTQTGTCEKNIFDERRDPPVNIRYVIKIVVLEGEPSEQTHETDAKKTRDLEHINWDELLF